MTCKLYVLVLQQPGRILDLGPLLGSDILWSSLETCTNMLIWGPLNSNIWWPTLEAWKPVQTCSLEFPIPSLRSDIWWWSLKLIRLTGILSCGQCQGIFTSNQFGFCRLNDHHAHTELCQ